MTFTPYGTHARAGDLAQLVSVKHKFFLVRLIPGEVLQTHRGMVYHDHLIGQRWGSEVASHLGSRFFLMEPALADLITETQRNSQILYPKDIGFILITMNIGPGKKVIEAGTGSGGLTTALAHAVGDEGHVYSYEIRSDMQALARKNLIKLGLDHRVTFVNRDITNGFDETDLDAFFLDVQHPFEFLPQVKRALKPGGFFGSITPTTNNTMQLITALQNENFAFIDVCEILLRYYRGDADRFRPADRMVGHTGYLVFGRPVIPISGPVGSDKEMESEELPSEDDE